jgi:hypothetical protein
LRDRTAAGDSMPAHSHGMQPQHFFQPAHGQPLLWQLVSPSSHWSQSPLLTCAAVPIRCRSPLRTINAKLIAFSSEY